MNRLVAFVVALLGWIGPQSQSKKRTGKLREDQSRHVGRSNPCKRIGKRPDHGDRRFANEVEAMNQIGRAYPSGHEPTVCSPRTSVTTTLLVRQVFDHLLRDVPSLVA